MKLTLLLLAIVMPAYLHAQAGWRKETGPGEWTRRSLHSSAVFNGRLYALNGSYNGALSDQWSTSDGIVWTEDTDPLPWLYRNGAASAAFGGKLWVTGGHIAGAATHDNSVWSTVNGTSWTEEVASAPWTGRWLHTIAVMNGNLWILGGTEKQNLNLYLKNDVWSSPDGINWTQEVAAANWSPREGHATVVFDNRLWVLGGWDLVVENDVWSSPDGINWTQITTPIPWQPRAGHRVEVFGNRMWLVGGMDANGVALNDVWSSPDGVNWVRETADAPWEPRFSHTSAVFRGRLWVHGGGPDDAWSYGMYIAPTKLGAGIIEVPYSKNLEVRLGVGPYTWSMVAGSLPPGLTADTSTTGATVNVSGVPTATGQWTFTMRVEDQGSGDWAEQEITLKINAQSSRADRTDDSGCANQPAPQLPAAILTAATATAALLRRRRQNKVA